MRPGGRRLHAGLALNPIDAGHMAGLQTCSSAGMSCIRYSACPRLVLVKPVPVRVRSSCTLYHTHGKCIHLGRLIAPL